jgi:hypothetical protein
MVQGRHLRSQIADCRLQGLALFIIERIPRERQLVPRVFGIHSWAL